MNIEEIGFYKVGGFVLREPPARDECLTVVSRDIDMHEFGDFSEVARREALHRHMTNEMTSVDMAAACVQAGDLGWTELGEGPDGDYGAIIARPEAWGDVILARKETPTSYHLSVVIDDALQAITHVVRGRDLFWSTSVHRLLQSLLRLPRPIYCHHRLVTDASGQKLSKSTGATGLRELRAAGATPADIRRLVQLP